MHEIDEKYVHAYYRSIFMTKEKPRMEYGDIDVPDEAFLDENIMVPLNIYKKLKLDYDELKKYADDLIIQLCSADDTIRWSEDRTHELEQKAEKMAEALELYKAWISNPERRYCAIPGVKVEVHDALEQALKEYRGNDE